MHEQVRAKGEEDRETLKLRSQVEKEHANYVDDLAQKRLAEDDRRAQASDPISTE